MATASTLNRKFELSADITVGVLLGGSSSERKISLRSGRAVLQAFKNAGVSVQALDPRNSRRFLDKLKKIDVAFLALHGAGGEDGSIQKRLERMGLPYTGSGPRASLDAFDKVRAKKLFQKAGVPTPDYCVVRTKDWQAKISRLGLPAFAKPIADGSSVGAFPVDDVQKAKRQMVSELKRFKKLLIERKVLGREFTVGIVGSKTLPVIEMVPGRSFFDYKAKYTPGITRYDVPARITPQLSKKIQKIALKAHRALGLRDLSRVDLMVDESGRIAVLEANSIPGMTATSLLPKAARAAGISFEELCLRLTRMALKRRKTN